MSLRARTRGAPRGRTEHDVARADEDHIERVCSSDMRRPGANAYQACVDFWGCATRTHLSMGISLEGSIEGRREDAPDCRLEMEVGESSTDGRRKEVKEVGLVSSEGRRDMVGVGRRRGTGVTSIRWGRYIRDRGRGEGRRGRAGRCAPRDPPWSS